MRLEEKLEKRLEENLIKSVKLLKSIIYKVIKIVNSKKFFNVNGMMNLFFFLTAIWLSDSQLWVIGVLLSLSLTMTFLLTSHGVKSDDLQACHCLKKKDTDC